MARYIDANDFKREMEKYLPDDRELALKVLKSIKTADVVEVVRCKDCEWWDRKNDHDEWCHCNENDREGCWQADDYCSWGERREDGTDR